MSGNARLFPQEKSHLNFVFANPMQSGYSRRQQIEAGPDDLPPVNPLTAALP